MRVCVVVKVPFHNHVSRLNSSLLPLSSRFLPVVFAAGVPFAALAEPTPAGNVSYYKQIRPIMQANCQGCHQPAKAKGGYVMTSFAKLLAGGDSKDKHPAVVASKPEKSMLLQQITPMNGEADMPKGKPPLSDKEINLVKQWIAQGAVDDTPADAVAHYDNENPPTYTRQPVIPSVDYSPDGKLLAVAGFHEVMLHKSDGSGLAGRLIGVSSRIQSVRFSPDGKWLAAAGGVPGMAGEVQVWDVSAKTLKVSSLVSWDTLYGVSWSPDGKYVAFGGADNIVRAIEAETGKEVLQMGSHGDWALATAFSVKGDHLISAGRDMTSKLTEFAIQRFVDNITSITPGALKGGIQALASHPKIEHFIAAGSSGTPKVYRTFREKKREIGDDSQHICDLFPMPGRVFDVRFSTDGKRIACGSSLDGTGEVVICSYDFDADVPADVKNLMHKIPANRNDGEKNRLIAYRDQGVKLMARVPVAQSGIYAVAFSPDSGTVAAAGADGKIRLLNAVDGSITKEFDAVTISPDKAKSKFEVAVAPREISAPAKSAPESLPQGATVASLEIHPPNVKFSTRNEYAQLIVTARLSNGEAVDATRLATYEAPAGLFINPRGWITPRADGKGELKVKLGDKSAVLPFEVAGIKPVFRADYIRDVNPAVSKLGCNAGTCHGSKDGRAGFKLSLRGYDAEYDLRAFTDDLASRRVNVAAPDESLMLLKARAEVPHEGGRLTDRDQRYYQILRQWIAEGAKVDAKAPKVTGIEIFPKNPVVQIIGSKQQLSIVAAFADGTKRDVTSESFVSSGNTDVANVEDDALVITIRRGEAPIMARYEGSYAATTVTVMGDRAGFAWQDPPKWNQIDELVAAKWQRLKILPSELSSDENFLRRVTLDLTGLPPTADAVRQFLADTRETRVKRDEVIDKLVGSPEYIDQFANQWANLLQVNRKFLGQEGAKILRDWIHSEVAANRPYDQFVRSILTASGSTKENPPAAYYKILRTPVDTMENTTHLFLATRFNCNKCHDHPFERWTQDQYYQVSAYFAQIGRDRDPANPKGDIGKTDVEKAKPLYELIKDTGTGEVEHDRTKKVTPPEFPYPAKFTVAETATRRESLAAWMTSPDNRYFASSYANRIWGHLFGIGIIEPLDDIRAGNPPTNPELLDYLTQEFIKNGFNVQHLVRTICKSRTYQLELKTNKWNEDDKSNYSHAVPRRLPAEALFDAVFTATGSMANIPGVPPGTRAAQLPDSAFDVPSGLITNLGRPVRESSCECERSNELRLGSVMSLLSGPTVSSAINDPGNAIAKLVETEKDDRKLVNELYMRFLSRPAKEAEISNVLTAFSVVDSDHAKLAAALEAKEKSTGPALVEKEAQRTAAIAALEKEIAPIDAEVAAKQKEKIDAADKSLKDFETKFTASLPELETQLNMSTDWQVIDPTEMTASNGATLEKAADLSVNVSGAKGKGTYQIVADTKLHGITAIKLEALADDKLPDKGPGRGIKGNFVLTELELFAKQGAGDAVKVALQNAQTEFTQKKYAIAQVIDGNLNDRNNGWAIGGKTGVHHIATFDLKEPLKLEGGGKLAFTFHHQFDDDHGLGRFRLSVTTSKLPISKGLAPELAAALKVAADKRDDAQKAALLAHLRSINPELKQFTAAVEEAKKPLVDARLVDLRKRLELAKQPVPIDPQLALLREEVAMSTKQLENKRLTSAQDIAWALINSPAFLFNY